MRKQGRVAVATACAIAVAAAPAGAAAIWTPVPSGTAQDITAIEYRSDTQAWLATGGGRIHVADATGTFVERFSDPAVSFTGIAFRADGVEGLAVTAFGEAYRSSNGGRTWTRAALGLVGTTCAGGSPLVSPRRLEAVFWSDNVTAYLLGGGAGTSPVVIRYELSGGGTSSSNANWTFDRGCRVGSDGDVVTDGFGLPRAPSQLRFVTDDFGAIFASADRLATPASMPGHMTGSRGGTPKLAADPANPTRMWAVSRDGGLTYSEAGGAERTPMTIAGSPPGIRRHLYDVAFTGGTLVAVGDHGEIYTSVDGKTAHLQRAAAPDDGARWRAVDLASGEAALVGGVGGRLVRSANADAIPAPPAPPRPPTPPAPRPPTPRPPAPPAPRPPARRTGGGAGGRATPPNVAGSRATTKTTGGARLTTWKRVALSRGRYVPVRISARTPRRFVIEIRRAKRPRKRIAMSKARLRKRGRKLVRVPLRKRTKTGKYRIVVRVYKGRRAIGKRVDVAFLIVR